MRRTPRTIAAVAAMLVVTAVPAVATTTDPTTPADSATAPTDLAARIAKIEADVAALTARVQKLEGGTPPTTTPSATITPTATPSTTSGTATSSPPATSGTSSPSSTATSGPTCPPAPPGPGGGDTPPATTSPTSTGTAPSSTTDVVTLPATGAPPDPGNKRVKSPNPSPVADPAKLTGPRIRIKATDNPETILNGKTLTAGTVVEIERGAVFEDVRVTVSGEGTPQQPVLVTAVGEGPDPVFKATKAGDGKDGGILTTSGSNVHLSGITFADSKSVAVAANAAPTIMNQITGQQVVIGTWIKGDGSKVWNSYFNDLQMMPDTPGPNDDYGASGIVVEADDVEVEGVTCRECHAASPDYDQYGGDGSFAEVWMKGDNLRVGFSYLDGGPRILEAGGLGEGNSATNMRVHNFYGEVRKDAPFHMNPEGEYSGVDTSGFVEEDNTIERVD